MRRLLPSCDTLAVCGRNTISGYNILGKNSDRDVTESQPLIYFPAEDHDSKTVKCTYIEIEQVPHTYAMIGSKPWWIWGFEHGINECGVAIGNEADWATVEPVDEDLLLGMDILRLALERGSTAKEAVDVITSLLEKYGQGGGCQYGRARMDFTYHNSFMVADAKEIWLVETVDRYWITRRIHDYQAISNVYTIEEEYDACAEGLIDFAVSNGLHRAGEKFNFSKSFMRLDGTNLSGHPRYERMMHLLRTKENPHTPESVLSILRDHYEGESNQSRWSPASVMSYSVCMHGTGKIINGCQSAATMVVDFHDSQYKELLFTYWGSMCPPCSSFIIPFYNTGYVPEALGKGTNVYSPDSFWWKVERMVTAIESNYEKYISYIQDIRPEMENRFRARAAEGEAEAKKLLEEGNTAMACAVLNAVTDACFQEVDARVGEITEKIEADLKVNPGQIYKSKYIEEYRAATHMDFI